MTPKVESQPRAVDAGGVGLSASSFATIYGEHMPELTAYCRSIVRDRHDAEDAAQSAMERALRALSGEGAAPPERMRPWLFTIAHREAVNVLRRRRHSAPGLDEATVAARAPDSPEELAAVRERLAVLLADLRELAPRQREVLVARELGGRSYREIAQSLGTTEAGAQQAVLEARRSLRAFEAGRCLECDDVQAWISAHDHARVRTRRVRAHLRACAGCRGFQGAIGARRRDLALLLPGLGGAGWSALGGLFAGGAAKALTAGAAAVVAGAALVSSPQPPPPSAVPARPAATATAASTHTARAVPVSAQARGARTDTRTRTVTTRSAPTAKARRQIRATPTGQPAKQTAPEGDRLAGRPVAEGRREPPEKPGPTAAVPAAPPPAENPAPTSTPSPVRDVVTAVEPVVETVSGTVDQTLDTVTETVDEVVGSLPELPALPELP